MFGAFLTQNLGTIKCSNLCTEIVEYTSPEEVSTLWWSLHQLLLTNSLPPFLPLSLSLSPSLPSSLSLSVMVQVAVCNLASIALNRFVTPQGEFDFQTLFDITKVRSISHI